MRVGKEAGQIPGSPLEPLIDQLYEELDAKGIPFHPPCYLADEWLCPDKVPLIGIPFCLAHPRLKQIEQKMMFEVEGGTDESCIKLLRHECGHALNYAYQLYKRTRWRELFGRFSAAYSDSYYYQPYSRRYVVHLEDNYAQAHPDEDFAETFAVWLAPNANWEQKYRGWPVVKKLQYVDGLINKIGDRAPTVTAQGRPPWSALFSTKSGGPSPLKASKILRHHRRQLVNSVTRWTGHRKYDIHQLVNSLIARSDTLELFGRTGDTDNMIGVTALVTAIANNTLRTARRRQ
ncbi:MAG: putative zinc-binding metallopeptidase, partial [Planctomycetota bacterium]